MIFDNHDRRHFALNSHSHHSRSRFALLVTARISASAASRSSRSSATHGGLPAHPTRSSSHQQHYTLYTDHTASSHCKQMITRALAGRWASGTQVEHFIDRRRQWLGSEFKHAFRSKGPPRVTYTIRTDPNCDHDLMLTHAPSRRLCRTRPGA